MGLSKELLDILACPKCKGEVRLNDSGDGLICDRSGCRRDTARAVNLYIHFAAEISCRQPRSNYRLGFPSSSCAESWWRMNKTVL